MGRTTRSAKDERSSDQLLTLEQIDASLGGTGRQPGDVAWVRTAPKILEAMARTDGAAFATLRCERLQGGMRIIDGQDVLLVARTIRARAMARGDLTWAALMGRRLVFHVQVDAASPGGARGTAPARSSRSGRRTAAVATS